MHSSGPNGEQPVCGIDESAALPSWLPTSTHQNKKNDSHLRKLAIVLFMAVITRKNDSFLVEGLGELKESTKHGSSVPRLVGMLGPGSFSFARFNDIMVR
jgi:hypothetical protein